MKKRTAEGNQIRPDFVIIDDPQDEDSAASPNQVEKRLNVIHKAILRSAGHKTGMSVVMPCTVIQKDDLVDQLLDKKKRSAWQGERIPFVRSWATAHETLWIGKYKDLRTTYNDSDPEDHLRARRDATNFYAANRDEMDAGAVVSWEHCYSEAENEISAIQHAYNALIDDGEEVFASEFQNEPLRAVEDNTQISVNYLESLTNNLGRRDIPNSCERLTAFIDVQHEILYYAVVAWAVDFTGYIIDYGHFPEQGRSYFAVRDVKIGLTKSFKGSGQEGAWRAGFSHLVGSLCGREWPRDDGTILRINRLLIDANEGNASQTIHEFCRTSDHAAVVMPSKGRGLTSASRPFSEYRRNPGDRVSEYNWRIPARQGKNTVRYIMADVNWWKSFVRSRLRTAMGDSGALTVWGKPADHKMFFDHMASEYSIRTEGRGRSVDEWRVRPNCSENHYWDCVVGCAVAASEQGVELAGDKKDSSSIGRRGSFSEMQRRKKKGARNV
jgi:phage terminase large subunit GpA-like protein